MDAAEMEKYRSKLENASSYGDIWEVVKATVASVLNQRRTGMMLFLDDLPIQLGAYHPVGTNNIILNRVLVQAIEASTRSRLVVNALIYNLLLHEYLHALGYFSEFEVRRLVYHVAKECFGEDHIAAAIAKRSPWALLKGMPLDRVASSKRIMEIVKDFEKADSYIV
ncbi:MAG: hypothetical protein RMJ15_10205 [Nitrososphaerota archaeon]|nr:hypothetical protein [Candidatus Bathyarchaeota archaeon]MDW8024087.1 hypothetical protein [Nitrososphaerota archaeon]